jgi:DNA-directed RNA polymerase subunit beta
MCPIETPEGPNIGLIGALATYARVNEYGFIETPYRKVVNGRVTNEIVYYDAADEEDFIIAQANAPVDAKGNFTEPRVLVRRGPMGTGVLVGQDRNVRGTTSEIDYVLPTEVDLIDVSPKQIISVSTALIPFVEHDDANRALMGANMQKQAVPLLVPEAPFVGTGVEAYAAEGAKSVILAEGDGEVVYSDAEKIEIKYGKDQVDRYGKKLGTKVYRPRIFESSDDSSMTARTNQGTSLHFRVRVDEGQTVKRGDVLADGPSTDRGDLALGKNLLVAFMPWEGYNYEDAIILSERLVRDDVLTSVHIESYEVDARDTKLGDEEITRDIPNVSESVLANLDDAGIIRVGSEVGPGDVLVGKVTPKGETEQTPEERLLRAIFGEKAREVRDTSLKVPHGSGGIVINVSHTSRAKGDELAPGVNDFVEVFVAQRRKIGVGDKLAGRHGNKGVISKILPEEDMPYLEDGTPVDIILNPLGVPSRMNVGQVLESHLGYAARHGWKGLKDSVNPNAGTSGKGDVARRTRPRTEPAKWVATPAFDGAHWDEKEKSGNLPTIQELFTTLNPDSSTGKVLMGNDGKVTLYNGRTGLPYDNKISVGYVYILKLNHLVDDKIHARSTGPYSMITQQPLGGKAQFGGQRFGEMEVWALEAYGAAYALQELLTIKSDDVSGRVSVYEAIVTGKNIPQPGIPESFKVLIKEMKSLCIDVEVLGRDGAEIKMNEIDEDMIRKAQDLGIDISRHERGSDEEDARREAERQMRNF